MPGALRHVAARSGPERRRVEPERSFVTRGVTSYEGFHASRDDASRALSVAGTVVFCTSGWSARLRRHDGPPGVDPLVLELELVIDPPPADAMVLQMLTPVDLGPLRVPDPSPGYREIRFRVVGSEDDPPAKLDVRQPQP